MAVAQDSGGEAAAGPHYDEAGATFTTLIDPTHHVTALYRMVNVPTGVWIDEQGRLVRPPETAWSKAFDFGSMHVGDERYADALRDWVARGDQSPYVLDADALSRRIDPGSAERRRADAHFRLAVHLRGLGHAVEAAAHWLRAQQLDPDNWNYHRQAWTEDTPALRGQKWRAKYEGLGDAPYYEPLDLR